MTKSEIELDLLKKKCEQASLAYKLAAKEYKQKEKKYQEELITSFKNKIESLKNKYVLLERASGNLYVGKIISIEESQNKKEKELLKVRCKGFKKSFPEYLDKGEFFITMKDFNESLEKGKLIISKTKKELAALFVDYFLK